MRILIFGATGMLGHKLYQELSREHHVFGTIRTGFADVERFGIFEQSRVIENVDATDRTSVTVAIEQVQPECVINAIGVIKQVATENGPEIMVKLNSVFPHEVVRLAVTKAFRFITISTDCVFDGSQGGYTETDHPDAHDLYGMSKLLGEVTGSNALTLRTSIIGRELGTGHSIVEWFLRHRGDHVEGYTKALYSGVTTIEFARVISRLLIDHSDLRGVYNLSAEPITKYDLLGLLNDAFAAHVDIMPSDAVVIDRTLDSARLRQSIGYTPPSWRSMISELAGDPTPYDSF